MRGKTSKHRDHVIVEYAPNEEVMIRDKDWKLIYERGVERRTDGYDTGGPLVPNKFRLYDMFSDPGEMKNVADDPAHAAVVKRMTDLLVDHLAKTSRLPELIPTSTDPLTVLEFGVQSRDVRSSKQN